MSSDTQTKAEAQATHTPEPWFVEVAAVPAGGKLWGAVISREHPAGGAGNYPEDMTITWRETVGKANAERIVACVNACAGIANPEAIPELITAATNYIEFAKDEEKLLHPGFERQEARNFRACLDLMKPLT